MAKRAVVNYFIDIGLTITFLLTLVSGLVRWPGLFHQWGQRAQLYQTLTFIHDWSGLIMTLLVLVHIILHWRWIVCMTKAICRKKKNKGEAKECKK